jgi:hypothetical protein
MRVLISNKWQIFLSDAAVHEFGKVNIDVIDVEKAWSQPFHGDLTRSRKKPQIFFSKNKYRSSRHGKLNSEYEANFTGMLRSDKRILDVFDLLGQNMLHDDWINAGQQLKTVDVPDTINYGIRCDGMGIERVVEKSRTWKF